MLGIIFSARCAMICHRKQGCCISFAVQHRSFPRYWRQVSEFILNRLTQYIVRVELGNFPKLAVPSPWSLRCGFMGQHLRLYFGQGRFLVGKNMVTARACGAIAGGSGITPVLSTLQDIWQASGKTFGAGDVQRQWESKAADFSHWIVQNVWLPHH